MVPPTHVRLLCIVRMRITPRESIRKIAKDILYSKAGEEKASDVTFDRVLGSTSPTLSF